jgi:hypothetical protein
VEGNAEVTADNWAGGVQIESIADPATILPQVRSAMPYPSAYVELQTADDAFDYVLANSGATLPRRDAVDERIVDTVRTGRVTSKASEVLREELSHAGFAREVVNRIADLVEKGIITDVTQVGGYPKYEGTPYNDADIDGLPDDWELRYGLDPNDPVDAATDLNGDGYTNIEDFLNRLDPMALKVEWPTPRTYVDLFEGSSF